MAHLYFHSSFCVSVTQAFRAPQQPGNLMDDKKQKKKRT